MEINPIAKRNDDDENLTKHQRLVSTLVPVQYHGLLSAISSVWKKYLKQEEKPLQLI